MAHHHGHEHHSEQHHAESAKSRGLHKDWRVWVGVVLMLAAMAIYVLSDNESLRIGGGAPGAGMPAAGGPAAPAVAP